MRLTIERLSDYSFNLDACADEASQQVMSRLASRWLQVRGLELKESIPLMREEATATLVNAENTFGVSSAAIGHNMLADMLGKNPGRGIEGMEVADEYADSQSARYWVNFLDGTDSGFEKFLNGIVERARRNVSHAADREVALASAKMGRADKRVRFARVPQGPSCGFCIMLASRGFVYATRQSAGEFTRFHDNCDCRIVAGINGVEVEGYDPNGLYDRYAKCVRLINGGTLNSSNGKIFEDWERLSEEEQAEWGKKVKNGKDAFNSYFEHRVCQEMDMRDREWLYTGTCESTRRTALPFVSELRKTNPEVYDDWQEIVSRVRAESVTLKQSQLKHIKDTSHFNRAKERPSYFVMDDEVTPLGAEDLTIIRDAINQVAGTGIPEVFNGDWSGSEKVPHAGIKAIDGRRGKIVDGIKIHYGKAMRDVHAAPMWSGGDQ